MENNWDKLLQKIGIAKTFSDAIQQDKTYHISDETLCQMINNLGFSFKDKNQCDRMLEKLENMRWQYTTEAIYVVRMQDKIFDVVVPSDAVENIEIKVYQNKKIMSLDYEQEIIGRQEIGKREYSFVKMKIISDMAPGYYDIDICFDHKMAHTKLAVTPDMCYVPDIISQQKIWGYAIQLYALSSKRNWGVGDFTDLKNFVDLCERQGADVIGVNPLNTLFHDFPENASPYSSISRLFLNPIYIDVENVHGYKPEYKDEFAEILHKVKQSENICYTEIYNTKISVLERIFSEFYQNKKTTEYKKFIKFCNDQGVDLEQFAIYQTIYTIYVSQGKIGWKNWPAELQNPYSKAVFEFKNSHQRQFDFFRYLQFIAAQQLQEVSQEIKKCGLKIGLYRDLPVGLCKDSEEIWAGNDLFIKECGAGAPPDVFFPQGQKWCLGAFNPYTLKANAYLPFIKILRAAMADAGALRIDHVMSLMRLYVIPDKSDEGTYIYYNFTDMLGLVVLESYLNKCMIVGESIGNVPDGFVEKLHERGIYSLSVLWGERWNGYGDFKMPYDFPQKAYASVGTHDMAPLKMRWFGYDIETMYQLKMISDDARTEQYKGREDERCRLLRALDNAGVWPQDKPRQGDCLYGEGYPNGIMEAVEKYVSLSNSDVYLAQLEDIFGVTVLQNLPGTDVDKHPNWRRKLPVDMEDFENNDDFVRARKAIMR